MLAHCYHGWLLPRAGRPQLPSHQSTNQTPGTAVRRHAWALHKPHQRLQIPGATPPDADAAPSVAPVAVTSASSEVSDDDLPAGAATLPPHAAPALPAPEPWKWEDSEDAVLAYGVLAFVLLLGAVPNNPALRSDNASDLLYFISLAVCTQYIGAHRALTTSQRQQISFKEGLLAPVLASVSLFSCYLIVRFLPDISLSTLINAYFWLLGSFAATGALGPVLRQLGGPAGRKTLKLNVPDGWAVDEKGNTVNTVEFAPSDVAALVGGVALSTASVATGDYTLNNTMACLIASDILQLIGIRSFRVAALLLGGLMVYDLFWVFGSPKVIGDNVMLTVATSDIITGPSRLLFPKALGGTSEAADFPYSLLGLGDVAVPGLLACLALRYDASRAVDMRGRADAASAAIQAAMGEMPRSASATEMADSAAAAASAAYDRFADVETEARQRSVGQGSATDDNGGVSAAAAGPRPPASDAVLSQRVYFTPVMVAYVAGLLMAFAANSITGLGQPALLYIVPSVLGAVAVTAATRGEVSRLWAFSDVPSFGLPEPPKKE